MTNSMGQQIDVFGHVGVFEIALWLADDVYFLVIKDVTNNEFDVKPLGKLDTTKYTEMEFIMMLKHHFIEQGGTPLKDNDNYKR